MSNLKKRVMLAGLISVSVILAGCSGAAKNEETGAESEGETVSSSDESSLSEDDQTDNSAWDELEAQGNVQTVNGALVTSITILADYVDENLTQEQLDAEANDSYVSATLNDDGSVTYTLTKDQHKSMFDSMTESIDEALQKLADSKDNTITGITHNSDFTEFNVTVSSDKTGITEDLISPVLFMYGRMRNAFTGKTVDNYVVNYLDSEGTVISTVNSSDSDE